MKQAKTYNFIEITKKELQQYQAAPITNEQLLNPNNLSLELLICSFN